MLTLLAVPTPNLNLAFLLILCSSDVVSVCVGNATRAALALLQVLKMYLSLYMDLLLQICVVVLLIHLLALRHVHRVVLALDLLQQYHTILVAHPPPFPSKMYHLQVVFCGHHLNRQNMNHLLFN